MRKHGSKCEKCKENWPFLMEQLRKHGFRGINSVPSLVDIILDLEENLHKEIELNNKLMKELEKTGEI